jgi:hypothetical protein
MGFYISMSFSVLSFCSAALFYRPGPRPNPQNLALIAQLRAIDWVGVFLATGGVTLTLVGLELGGNPHSWDSAIVLSPLLIGIATMLALILWEWKARHDGIMPHQLFAHRNYAVVLVLSFVNGFAVFVGQAFLPQQINALFTKDPVMVGVYNIPFNGMGLISGGLSGILMALFREGKYLVVTSTALLVIASGLMAVEHANINFAAWFFPSAMLGTGIGMLTILTTIICSLCTPPEYIATAVALTGAARGLGGGVGLVIFSQIFESKINAKLPQQVTTASIRTGLPESSVPLLLSSFLLGNITMISEVPGLTPLIIAAVDTAANTAYAESFRYIWYSLIPFGAVAFVLSLYLHSNKLEMTEDVASGVAKRHRPSLVSSTD